MGRRVKNFSVAEDTGASAIEIPKVNTNQRPTGQRGQIVYNKTTNTFQAYIGTGGSAGWFNISTASGEKTLTIDRFEGDGSTTVEAKNEVPLGHKLALVDLNEGDTIIKYGHDIGKVVKAIKKGEHVHVHNVKTKKW